MARVFTITQGLENMGALKTGGQGSVYKGRRIGEIITAIKILPTPIYSESADDKNFIAFENEVAKLKKVNEHPNPNVVKILSSGITDTGNFPFIEMEYIEGPDLEDLLKSPNAPIFTIKETLKVAEQLANALAHCHKTDVRHGDIKSNNVKFNTATGNYILLDFGLAIMSDEQRRSSLRQAGAIEFMAPEQNTGQMLFQTDIYSFGIVLFELLAGTVPFELKNKGETARNEVRLAHMVSPLPDILQLRRQALPLDWDKQKQDTEMQVPEWMLNMIYKCLEKKPQSRFENGMELYHYIGQKSVSKPDNTKELHQIASLEQTNQSLLAAQQELNKKLLLYQDELAKKEEELNKLQSLLAAKETNLQSLQNNAAYQKKVRNGSISKSAFTALWLLAFVFGACTVFYFFENNSAANPTATNSLLTSRDSNTIAASPADTSAANKKEEHYDMPEPQNEEHSVEKNVKDENADQDEGSQNDKQSETQNEEKNLWQSCLPLLRKRLTKIHKQQSPKTKQIKQPRQPKLFLKRMRLLMKVKLKIRRINRQMQMKK